MRQRYVGWEGLCSKRGGRCILGGAYKLMMGDSFRRKVRSE